MEIEELYENTVPAETDPLDDVTETAASGMAILTERVERLIRLCDKLSQKNNTLRAQNLELQVERDELREKNEQSRSRIEAMVVRLKSLE